MQAVMKRILQHAASKCDRESCDLCRDDVACSDPAGSASCRFQISLPAPKLKWRQQMAARSIGMIRSVQAPETAWRAAGQSFEPIKSVTKSTIVPGLCPACELVGSCSLVMQHELICHGHWCFWTLRLATLQNTNASRKRLHAPSSF